MTEVFNLVLRHGGRNIGRPDGAGCYAVNPDIPLAQLNGQRLGKGMNGPPSFWYFLAGCKPRA